MPHASDKSLGDLLTVLNDGGPWKWELADSDWYGDYLRAHPLAAPRVRIHDPRACIGVSGSLGPSNLPVGAWRRYVSQLETEAGADVAESSVDRVVGLLRRAGVRDLRPIEPYI